MAPAFATVMPSGWEAVVSPEGKTYYIDHNTRSTHWSPPAAATTARAVVVPAPARTRTCIAIGTMVVFALSCSVHVGKEISTHRHAGPFAEVPVWRHDAAAKDDALPRMIMSAMHEGTPILIRGGVKSWPALTVWTSEVLGEKLHACNPELRLVLQTTVIEQDGGKGPLWAVPPDSFVRYLQRRRDNTSQHRDLYVSEWEDVDEVCPPLLYDLKGMWPFTESLPWGPMLPFSHAIHVLTGLDVGELTGLDSPLYPALWWGPAHVRTGLHYDKEQFNLLCQVRGSKNVTLFAPEQGPRMYENDMWDQSAGISSVDMWGTDNDEKFPRFRQAVRAHVVVEPGDILVVPAYWWHAAESLSESISISARVDNTRVTELWASLLNTLHKLGLYKSCEGCCTCHRDVELVDDIRLKEK